MKTAADAPRTRPSPLKNARAVWQRVAFGRGLNPRASTDKATPVQEEKNPPPPPPDKDHGAVLLSCKPEPSSDATSEKVATVQPKPVDDGEPYNPAVDDSGVAFLPTKDPELTLEVKLAQFPMPPTSLSPSPRHSQGDASPAADQSTPIDPPPDEDAEVYEPRAAYDFVDEDEFDADADLTPARPGFPGQGAGGPDDGAEGEGEVWEGRGGRLTPCGDDEELEFEDVDAASSVVIVGQAPDSVPERVLHRAHELQPSKTEAGTQTQTDSVETTLAAVGEDTAAAAVQDMKEEAQPETVPERLEVIEEVEEPVAEAEKAKKERIMAPEEEAKWAAYLERRRAACERHAKKLDSLLARYKPEDRAWLERSGVDVDELMRSLRWEVPVVLVPPSSSPVSSSSATSSESTSHPSATSQSTSTCPTSDASLTDDDDATRARQRRLRDARRESQRSLRRALDSTRKVDAVMGVIQDVKRGVEVDVIRRAKKKNTATNDGRGEKEMEGTRTAGSRAQKGRVSFQAPPARPRARAPASVKLTGLEKRIGLLLFSTRPRARLGKTGAGVGMDVDVNVDVRVVGGKGSETCAATRRREGGETTATTATATT